jgi:hypothetical protein
VVSVKYGIWDVVQSIGNISPCEMLSWPPKDRPPSRASEYERECEELREQYHQTCKDLDDLHALVGALVVDRERLDWWFEQVTQALADGRVPRVYRTREALDAARRRRPT